MRANIEPLYFWLSLLSQLIVALLLGLAAAPAIWFIRWILSRITLGSFVEVLLFSLSLGFAFLLFGNTLLLITVLVRNLFVLRSAEQRGKVVSLLAVKTALYNLLLHTANVFFLSLMRGSFICVLFYRGMGARIGRGTIINTHRLWDVDLIEIGEGCVIGGNASISAHVLQGDRGRLRKVRIGNHVTIGANTSVMPGVVIEDNVVVGANSLVPMGMHLEKGKTYLGVPVQPT